jgi:hypothetical protein
LYAARHRGYVTATDHLNGGKMRVVFTHNSKATDLVTENEAWRE